MSRIEHCDVCIAAQRARSRAFTSLLVRRLGPIQIASVMEEWEAICLEKSWMNHLALASRPDGDHPPSPDSVDLPR